MGYGLLGATRLVLKTENQLQQKMIKLAKILAWILIVLVGVVSIWTPLVYPLVQQRWFNPHWIMYLAFLPVTTIAIFFALQYSLHHKKNDYLPYWLAVAFFLCPYVGFVISVYPYLVPYQMTIWQAASPDSSLKFILVGACIMLPVLLAYTFYSYRIFRGKVREAVHY
jgi:cytochrome d ubiquinol oxidase subunit II